MDSFNYMVTRHPLDFYPGLTEQKNVVKAADMERYNHRRIKMIGWYMSSKRISTKKGDPMKFLYSRRFNGNF